MEPTALGRLRLVELGQADGEVVWGLHAELDDGTPLLGLQPVWIEAEPLVGEREDVAVGDPVAAAARVGELEALVPVP